jgi:hypothetical protein
MRRRLVGVVIVAAAVLAACGGDDEGDAEPAPTTSAATTTEVATTEAPEPTEPTPTTEAPAATTEPSPEPTEAPEASAEWIPLDLGPECMCADGGPITFYERPADPTKVMLYFQGGGACFSAETCAFEGGSYAVDPGGAPGDGGLFDAANPENPVADYSIVYVPYCTGDVHIGDATTEYAPDLVVEHNGNVNGTKALEHLLATYPDAAEIVVAGASAGSIPTPRYAALLRDTYPEARITSFGDSSGAYGDNPAVNATIFGLWGSGAAIPDWPTTQDITPEEWSIPGITIVSGTHAPDVRYGRFDYDADEVQEFFATLTVGAEGGVLAALDATEAQIEAAGVDVSSFVAPGPDHTITQSNGFYDVEVDGVRLVEWLTELIEAEAPPADVTCTECR